MRLRQRAQHGRHIERTQGAQIDHFGADILRGKTFRRLQRLGQGAAIGHQREIATRTAHRGMVDIDCAGVSRKLALEVVQQCILEHDDGIRVHQCRPQHATRILERCRRHHPDTGNMRIPSFETVRMLCRELPAGTGGHADHQRNVELSA